MVSSIESPCIKLCKLQDNICIGCKRTLSEIAMWSSFTIQERQKIVKEIDKR